MRRYAIFVSSTWNYLPYLNALLNSIEKRKLHMYCENLDVHLIHENFPEAYINAVKGFSYNLIPVAVRREDYLLQQEKSRNRFFKFARFQYMKDAALDYDVVCLLDADMMIVSSEFMSLFDLVCGTDRLIGCNEKFKWTVCKSDHSFTYMLDDKPIFPEETKLWKFHCSVPIIFDMRHWKDVFDFYVRLVTEGYEIKDGERKKMGDIFSWNCAVQHEGRQNNLILFPMEVMTQVHYTNMDPERRVVNDDGYWHTEAGDQVYSLHGRICNPQWETEHWKVFEKRTSEEEKEQLKPKIQRTLNDVKREWHQLSYRGVRLVDYMPEEEYWQTMNRGK